MAACSAEFGILGPLEVWFEGRPVVFGAPKQRALLIALLLDANRTVSTDHLLECLWGDDPPGDAIKALRFHVSRLRATLRDVSPDLAGCVVTQPSGYQLDVEESRIDARRFSEAGAGRADWSSWLRRRRRRSWRTRSPSGAVRPWPTSHSTNSHKERYGASTNCASPRSSIGSVPISQAVQARAW